MAAHHVTIFSNGIADFRRRYAVSAGDPQEISIPVKTDDVADVLASLNVYGPVSLKSPPSFRPANENDSHLEIDPDNVLVQLASRLSGARVRLEKAAGGLEGTLVGLHTEQEAGGGERIEVLSLIVLTEQGFTKMPLRELQRLNFTDEAVRTEIAKALKRNLQAIKPDSTFIALTVATEQPQAEALLQYTIPAAAWKISYRLRRDETEESKKFEFQGFAIVDNTTDEDWTDFLVSVVTGEPITFSTDLAESKIPHRDHVNVVKDRALGSVEVEEAMPMPMMKRKRSPGEPAVMMAAAEARFGMTEQTQYKKVAPSAQMEEAAVQNVGDFCVFESKQPVTILAHRSAVIPMFQAALDDAETVLHYQHENHPERPYRSVRFKNEMPHSLGRGVCTVYEGGVYGGSCILPATPAGETCLLPHALETGVKIRRDAKPDELRTIGIQISEGICQISQFTRKEIGYQIQSLKEESFQVVIDHHFFLNRPQFTCRLKISDGTTSELEVAEKLTDGMRLSFSLAPREQLQIVVEETKVNHSRFELLADRDDQLPSKIRWIVENLIDTNGPLANDPTLKACLEIQKRLVAKTEEMFAAQQEINRLSSRQERLRNNIGTGGQNQETQRWRADLALAENRITAIEDNQLPALEQQAQALRAELRQALAGLAADWQEDVH